MRTAKVVIRSFTKRVKTQDIGHNCNMITMIAGISYFIGESVNKINDISYDVCVGL